MEEKLETRTSTQTRPNRHNQQAKLATNIYKGQPAGVAKSPGILHPGSLFPESYIHHKSEEYEECNEYRGIDSLLVHAVRVLLEAQRWL